MNIMASKSLIYLTIRTHIFSSLTDGIQHYQMVGPELILGKLFDEIGFNSVPDSLFRHLVISRLVFPLSKLKTSEYLLRYHHISVDISQIYRYLDKLVNKQKEEIQRISYEHTLKLFDGKLSVVFYDVKATQRKTYKSYGWKSNRPDENNLQDYHSTSTVQEQ